MKTASPVAFRYTTPLHGHADNTRPLQGSQNKATQDTFQKRPVQQATQSPVKFSGLLTNYRAKRALLKGDLKTFTRLKKELDRKNQTLQLQGINLQKRDLRSYNLKGANLQDAILEHANLSMNELQGTQFQRADLRSADFMMAKLQNADFTGAFLEYTDFTGADLTDANFKDALFEQTDFTGAFLNGTRFSELNLNKHDALFDYEGRHSEAVSRASIHSQFPEPLKSPKFLVIDSPFIPY